MRLITLISALAVASGYQAGISRVAVPRRATTLQASIADDALESIVAKIEAGKQRLAQIEELKVQLEQASQPVVSAMASRPTDLLDLVKEAQKQRDAAETVRHEVRYDVLTAQHESANAQAEQTIEVARREAEAAQVAADEATATKLQVARREAEVAQAAAAEAAATKATVEAELGRLQQIKRDADAEVARLAEEKLACQTVVAKIRDELEEQRAVATMSSKSYRRAAEELASAESEAALLKEQLGKEGHLLLGLDHSVSALGEMAAGLAPSGSMGTGNYVPPAISLMSAHTLVHGDYVPPGAGAGAGAGTPSFESRGFEPRGTSFAEPPSAGRGGAPPPEGPATFDSAPSVDAVAPAVAAQFASVMATARSSMPEQPLPPPPLAVVGAAPFLVFDPDATRADGDAAIASVRLGLQIGSFQLCFWRAHADGSFACDPAGPTLTAQQLSAEQRYRWVLVHPTERASVGEQAAQIVSTFNLRFAGATELVTRALLISQPVPMGKLGPPF